jgi:hypothetical protein
VIKSVVGFLWGLSFFEFGEKLGKTGNFLEASRKKYLILRKIFREKVVDF